MEAQQISSADAEQGRSLLRGGAHTGIDPPQSTRKRAETHALIIDSPPTPGFRLGKKNAFLKNVPRWKLHMLETIPGDASSE